MGTRPFGHFSVTKGSTELEKGKYDEALKSRLYINQNLRQIQNPIRYLRSCVKKINSGVFDNGQKNKVTRGDVFDFLKGLKADVIYFDPPYADTTSYEEFYNILDNILSGKKEKPEVSVFTKEGATQFLDSMFGASKHIKDWVISMGQSSEKDGIKPEELLAIVRKYKPHAQVRTLDHRWTLSNTSKHNKKENVEFMIYTYQDDGKTKH